MIEYPIKILAVDDDQDLCILTKDMLETFEFLKVDTVFSAKEAMAVLADHRYDAIVCDYQMPVEDGISFLRRLRASGDRTPFILFTGKGREEIVIEAIDSGADAYVQKGAETRSVFAELAHKIREAVSRMRAEMALMESEARYRSLIDGSSVGIVLTDTHCDCVYTNRRWLDITSLSEEETKGRGWMSGVHPKDIESFRTNWKRSIERGGEHSFEYRYVTNNDRTIWLLANAAPLKGKDGAVTAYMSTIVDITERKKAEEALIEKERTIAKASNMAKMGYWVWKAEKGVITSSDGLSMLLGIQGGLTLAHDRFFDMVHPDDRKMLIDSLEEALKGKGDLNIEHRMIRSDGSVITVRDTIEVTTTRGNRPVFILGMVQDISELKRLSETLKETENLYQIAFDTIAEGVFVKDSQGYFIASNEEAARILGIPSSEVLRTMKDVDWNLVDEDGRECSSGDIPSNITLQTGVPLNDVVRGIKFTSGEVRWISINTRPLLHGPGQKPYAVVVSFSDITKSRSAEQEKRHAEEALKESNRKLTLLSSITRHDILNQLQVLTGWVEVMDKTSIKKDVVKQRTMTAAKNIESLIRFTGEYEKLGAITPDYVRVRNEIKRISENIELTGITVKNELDDGEILADPLLNKVFYNLIENTSRHGKKATFIRFRSERSNGDYMIVCEDDGVGIPLDHKAQIFERGMGKNFGLGLFFAKEILSITGITIHEDGVPGEGARFVITVPSGKWR